MEWNRIKENDMRLLISILVFILVFAATFCFGVFVAWDFDLSNWRPAERFALASFGLIFAGAGFVAAWEAME